MRRGRVRWGGKERGGEGQGEVGRDRKRWGGVLDDWGLYIKLWYFCNEDITF